MNIESVRRSVARFGWSSSLRAKGLEVLGRAVELHVMRVLLIERPTLDLVLPSRRYTHGFLGEGAIRRFALDPVCDMSTAFVDEAISRGDRCYAILDGSVLASFRWFSRHLTPMDHGVSCQAGPRRAYVYHGFTRPQYRGRRLHATVAARALEVFRTEGVDGIIGVVDGANLSSLKSFARIGAEDLGACYVLRASGHTFMRVEASVERCGVRIERALPAQPPVASSQGGVERPKAA